FWRDEDAVKRWRTLESHRAAQAKGRGGVFADYRLRVASVVRDYGMSERKEAPQDSRKRHAAQAAARGRANPASRTASRSSTLSRPACTRKQGPRCGHCVALRASRGSNGIIRLSNAPHDAPMPKSSAPSISAHRARSVTPSLSTTPKRPQAPVKSRFH